VPSCSKGVLDVHTAPGLESRQPVSLDCSLRSVDELTADLVNGRCLLIVGGAAWLVALNLGLRRYWPRNR